MSLIEKHGITELSFLTQCYIAVFKDCYDTYHREIPTSIWKKDFNQFSKYVRTRGLGFLCLDLPDLDNILLTGLSTGKVVFTRPMFGRGHKPSFLKGLWLRIFDESGFLLSDADPNAVLFIRQIASLAKKAQISRDTSLLNKEKADGFISIEEDLRAPTKRWRHDDLYDRSVTIGNVSDLYDTPDLWSEPSEDSIRTDVLRTQHSYYQEVFDFLFVNFDDIEDRRIEMLTDSYGNFRMRHGPGATHDTSRFTDKWDIEYISPGLDHLMGLFPEVYTTITDARRRDQSSRLIFVPKDIKGPRLIAAEPIMNQYFQQGVYSFIKNYGLRHSGLDKVIDFTKQDLSQDFARRASIDGRHATVDLKDASDRLTLWLVERVFRRCPKFLNFIMSCRTPFANFAGEAPIELKKFATQGNASTFPIQSVVYAAIAIATVMHQRRLPINRKSIDAVCRDVRVFGDDIIVPTESYDQLVINLTSYGLVVNKLKSFHTGLFRESCGGDFFKGYNVTPIKIRKVNLTNPEACQMLIDVSNDAYRAGLWNLSETLTQLFPFKSRSEEYRPLVRMVNRQIQGGGIFTYGPVWNSHLKTRWDSRLQVLQYKNWFLVNKTWKVKRKPLSRAREQQLADITSASWNPLRIQRSQSFSKIGWQSA